MDPITGLMVGMAAVAVGAYIDAKFGVGIDVKQLRYERAFKRRIGERILRLGEVCSLWGLFELVEVGREMLWFEGEVWTYGEVGGYVHRLVAFLEEEGVKKGDTIAVFMTNSPEMVMVILALSKMGVVAGLTNIHLRDVTLMHCLEVSTAKTIISTPDLMDIVPEGLQHYTINLNSFQDHTTLEKPGITHLDFNTLPIPAIISLPAKQSITGTSNLIFTSGTTGKPKACSILNFQIIVTSTPLSHDLSNPQKYFPLRTYSPLPLFHGTAFFTGLSYSIGNSSTLCLARKFSSSRFFQDVAVSESTRILYVGELCRYLVNSTPTKWDREHKCIVATGNGLRSEIWEKFKHRFGVGEIREFYRSTEGIAKFDNFGEGGWGVGRIGFIGPVKRLVDRDTRIVKVDVETEEVWRDGKTGFGRECGKGEVGEVVGRVGNKELLTVYLGDDKATERKLISGLLEKGDLWQRMGDLVVWDGEGWVRFHDRMGDTFRWKGENVSAGEVRDEIAKIESVLDAVVYGVKLASYDGQAGAAAIALDSDADEEFMKGLYKKLRRAGLPAYAVPRLVRITKEIEANATFKKSKVDLMKKSWVFGADGNMDKLYWLDGKIYRPLDLSSWRTIETGRAKL